jgi:hypothetical protein
MKYFFEIKLGSMIMDEYEKRFFESKTLHTVPSRDTTGGDEECHNYPTGNNTFRYVRVNVLINS